MKNSMQKTKKFKKLYFYKKSQPIGNI